MVTAMSQKILTIEWAGPLDRDFHLLLLDNRAFRKFGFEENKPYMLKIGSLNSHLFIKSVPKEKTQKLFCSQSFFNLCQIPPNTTLTMKIEDNDTVSVGPIIGILSVKYNDQDNPFAKQSKSLQALCERAPKANCFIYVFYPEEVIKGDTTLCGYIPMNRETLVNSVSPKMTDENPDQSNALKPEDGMTMTYKAENNVNGANHDGEEAEPHWKPIVVPYPDLIYNRIPSRFWEAQEQFVSTLNLLKIHKKIPLFNPGFLDKGQVHRKLSENPKVRHLLPDTAFYQNPEDIEKFTTIHKNIFLKPCSGSLGRRIVRVSRHPEGYSYKFRRSSGELAEGDCTTAEELIHGLRFLMGNRQFLIQQAIPLALYEGQEFDVRLLMQKDRFGQWRRTKTYVRIVQPGSLTANLSTGAMAKSIQEVLRDVFGEEYLATDGIGENIRTSANRVVDAVETAFPGIWAELGIDFGLDLNGRVWLIEVNSKPFKALTSSTGTTQRIERSFMRPIEYAKFLLGFYQHSI